MFLILSTQFTGYLPFWLGLPLLDVPLARTTPFRPPDLIIT
jgi:hypothetical protein